jgi:hypothetical protein
LDERFNQTREVVNERIAAGRSQVTSAFNKVWADIEVMREAQRKRSEEARAAAESEGGSLQQQHQTQTQQQGAAQAAQANVQAAGQRASAYLSSWGSWAAEKRKQGWRAKAVETPAAVPISASASLAADEKVSVEERRPHIPTAEELRKAAAAENEELDAAARREKQTYQRQ